MTEHTASPYLTDIVDAITRVRGLLGDMPLETFKDDWEKQWAIERGVEIISEASRRLSAEIEARHPDIPWSKVAGIGNVLRHDYESVSAPIMWKLVREDLPQLDRACRDELARDRAAGGPRP
jgi:uncharacterized protein with HEPN domain